MPGSAERAMGKKQAPGLGRSLRGGGRRRAGEAGWRHTSELSEQGRGPPPQSVTEQSPLEAFLAAAELAGAAFAAEKLNARLAPGRGAAEEEAGRPQKEEEEEEEEKRVLRIPRRPPWDEQTSPAALNQAERDSFLRWRRQLAWLEEEESLLLTPFERNLDFWRQLWRVLERSDVVVQIVDARNPLLFRCPDLERYAKEISPEKENLILLNKADLLGEEQRLAWARFFEREGAHVVFWSALAEGNRLGANPKELETVEAARPLGRGLSLKEEQSAQGGSPSGTQQESDTEEEDGDVYEDCEEEEEEEEAWLTCSEDGEQESPPVPVGRSRPELSQPAPPVRNSSRLVQREELLEVFRAAHAGRKKVREGELTVGLVGYPNVGKSSTINTLLGKKKVSVSVTPGRTKHFQTLFVEPSLCLCDCPGLVMPSFVSTKAEMVCSGILPIDQLRDHVSPVSLISFLIPMATRGGMRGFMTDHGQPDQPRSARLVLKDYVKGKLLYCHPPPGTDAQLFQRGLQRLHPSKGGAAAQRNGEQPPGRGAKAKQAENPVDAAFFRQENVQALTRGNRAGLGYPAGAAAHSPSGPGLADGAGKPWKRHGNRNKKQKLRRLTRHLEA
ncbi:large subunit GTPase 1 homolog [Notechis scutatus]|uniref:Large subunit GTPase 1 homolog n=1 Tax=Notechis scutatus TaxID=8663 RepID=A0A6J1VSQ1_9SAUR|nr:large subunit GTPase 1 homolog [Notechis scutatus]